MLSTELHQPQAQPSPTAREAAAWAALMDTRRRLAAARAEWLSARAAWEGSYVDMVMDDPAPTETAAPRELAGVAS